MSIIDWIVLAGTILFIVGFGIWRSRGMNDLKGYFLSNRDMNWLTIGLSIMATQASAITFLSTPGQAFEDGMGFVQFYFGLPIATVILSVVVIPIYNRLEVYTAYEYLERRFDLKTRTIAAILFLMQRGLAAGFTIYAPALILSTVLGWQVSWTCVWVGLIVTTYTVAGGTKAVAVTQKQQMLVILSGMLIAGVILVLKLPEDISFGNAIQVAGKMGKLEAIDFSFDWNDRYNIWSGIIASTFLMLSYFGTDQSQVQRYLGGKSITESRIGLLISGMVKVPMQFLILFIGVMLFVFYQFERPALNYNPTETAQIQETKYGDQFRQLDIELDSVFRVKQPAIRNMLAAIESGNESEVQATQEKVRVLDSKVKELRDEAKGLLARNRLESKGADPGSLTDSQVSAAKKKDSDRVFLTFVLNYLPHGLIGLLIAVILSASMSSTSAELNALATTSIVDIYKRMVNKTGTEKHYVFASKLLTFLWGMYAIGFALFADRLENLIQAVNILGSLVYGTILGIFLVAFFLKWVKGTEVFIAAVMAELIVLGFHFLPDYIEGFNGVGFLWYNVIGCLAVIGFALLLHPFYQMKRRSA
jgi:SSS family transporter